jgi:hypothetical protein
MIPINRNTNLSERTSTYIDLAGLIGLEQYVPQADLAKGKRRSGNLEPEYF